MRPTLLLYVIALLTVPAIHARAQDALYRCESADGISIQGKPCPKGAAQRKIVVQHMIEPPPTPTLPTPPAPALAVAHDAPQAPANAMRGPSDPYPLWQCMRADGSTFDSRTGVAGKQWVVNPDTTDAAIAPAPAKIIAVPKSSILRPIEQTITTADAPKTDSAPPPAGAAAGQWVADQCVRLEPQQACDRFSARRDALRKQIYLAKPSERTAWAPEEQDLTSMLYAACRR